MTVKQKGDFCTATAAAVFQCILLPNKCSPSERQLKLSKRFDDEPTTLSCFKIPQNCFGNFNMHIQGYENLFWNSFPTFSGIWKFCSVNHTKWNDKNFEFVWQKWFSFQIISSESCQSKTNPLFILVCAEKYESSFVYLTFCVNEQLATFIL